MFIYLLFPRASDVAKTVDGKIKLRTAANDCRAHLLEVAVPVELQPQDIRICSPLPGREGKHKKMKAPDTTTHKNIMVFIVVTYRPVEAVAVVVQLSLFLKKIKLDPVVETRHFS